jgi:hypothetical protein
MKPNGWKNVLFDNNDFTINANNPCKNVFYSPMIIKIELYDI